MGGKMSNPSYGSDTQNITRLLIKSLFDCAKQCRAKEFGISRCEWFEKQKILVVETEIKYLISFVNEKITKGMIDEENKSEADIKKIKNEINRINRWLNHHLGDSFLRICHKNPQQGKYLLSFTIKLWDDSWQKNEEEFNLLWKSKRDKILNKSSVSSTKNFDLLSAAIKQASQEAREKLNPYYLQRISRLDNKENNYIDAIKRSINQNTKVILIYAPAGYGKSVLLGEIYDKLAHEVSWIALTLCAYFLEKKLDSTDSFSKALGESICYEEQPITEIAIKLNNCYGKGVLLVDTLDLILTQTFIPNLRSVLAELLKTGVTVVFTCREEEYNTLMFHNLRGCYIDGHLVKGFSDEEIRIATSIFIESKEEEIKKSQASNSYKFPEQILEMTAGDCKPSELKKIIENPLLLGMLCNLFFLEGRVPENFTVSRLYEKYWENKVVDYHASQPKSNVSLKQEICLLIAERLFDIFREYGKFQESINKFDVKKNWSDSDSDVLEKLVSDNVLEWAKTDKSKIRFFHQTFLEFMLARWLEQQSSRKILDSLLLDLKNEDWAYKHLFWYTIIRQLLTIEESDERFEDIRQRLNINQLPAFNALVFAAASRENFNGLKNLLELGLKLDSPSHQETLRKAIASVPIQLANPAYDFFIKMMQTGQKQSAVNAAKSASTMITQWWDLLSPRINKTLNVIGESNTGYQSEISGSFLGELKELLAENLDANILKILRSNYDVLGMTNHLFLIQLHLIPEVSKEERIELIKILLEKSISNNLEINKGLSDLVKYIFRDDPCLLEGENLSQENWLTMLISQINNQKMNRKWNSIYNQVLADCLIKDIVE
jgi:hypothetical protein